MIYSWKRAAFAPELRIEIDKSGFTAVQRNKTQRVEYSHVRSIRYFSPASIGFKIHYMYLYANDKKIKLDVSLILRDRIEIRPFASAISAILKGVASHQPGFEVMLGQPKGQERLTFLLAGVFVLAVVIGFAAFDESMDITTTALVIAAMLGAFAWTWYRWPPRKLPRSILATALAGEFEQMAQTIE
ncbi:MAG: hypothetical protein Tsb0010_05150 [Parvularculaceae bacterium]